MQLVLQHAISKKDPQGHTGITNYNDWWLSIGFLIDGTNRESTEGITEPIMQKSAGRNCLKR